MKDQTELRNEKREKTIEIKKKKEAELLERLGDESLVDFLGKTNISEKDKEIARRILKRNLKRKARNKAKGKFIDNDADIVIAEDDSDDIYFDDDDFEDTLYYDTPLPYTHLEFYNNHHKNNRTWNFLLDMHNFSNATKAACCPVTCTSSLLLVLLNKSVTTKITPSDTATNTLMLIIIMRWNTLWAVYIIARKNTDLGTQQ